jgi:serine/threonine-protein kinase HipA
VDRVEVCLDAEALGPLAEVGYLLHRRVRANSTLSFTYTREWLANKQAFALDPRLNLYAGEQFAAGETISFGIFLDSAPDRWGRLLLDRREALLARTEKRSTRALSEWDYLLGVHDETRMGALRFRRDAGSPFLDDAILAVPPVTSLPALEAISLAFEREDAENLPAYRQWLATLIAPGTSLGGSRPKANFRETGGSLWIAKFPSHEDRRDVGAWEKLLHDLATDCRITVPGYAVKRFNSRHHSFCSKRFDRTTSGGRRFFVSAMTLLERRDGDGGSYLELAEFIEHHGAQGAIEADLEQLFRRVLFNVLVGNTDDHLRNHGFIRELSGWRLAPAYDLNPNPARHMHALRLDETSEAPDLDAVLRTADFYRLTAESARGILDELRTVTREWKKRAKALKLSATEIAAVEEAFALSA